MSIRTGEHARRGGRLALAVFTFAIVQHPAAQVAAPAVEVSPNPAVVGAPVAISITLPGLDAGIVTAALTELPAEIGLEDGPDIHPFVDLHHPRETETRVTFVVVPKEAGRFILPAVTLAAGSRTFQSERAVLSVGAPSAGGLAIPVRGEWRSPAGPLFVGETVPLELLAVNEESDASPTAVPILPTDAIIDPAPGLAAVASVTVGDATLYTLPAAAFELTPTSSGTLAFGPTAIRIGDRTGYVKPFTLDVHADPDGIAESRAVGRYAFRAWAERDPGPEGEELVVHERVEGTGNLPHLRLPDPSSATGAPSVAQNRSEFRATEKGYEGFRESIVHYLITANLGEIVVPDFVWFDPLDGQVLRAPGGAFTAAAVEGEQAPSLPEIGTTSGDSPPFSVDFAPLADRFRYHRLHQQPIAYLLVAPGPVAFALFVRKRRRRGGLAVAALLAVVLTAGTSNDRSARLDALVREGVSAYQEDAFKPAEDAFSAALAVDGTNAVVGYDLALSCFRDHRYGEAVRDARTAIFYGPLAPEYRALLNWMVGRIGVLEQVPPAPPIHPDLFFFGLVVTVNMAGLIGLLAVYRRRGSFVIGVGLCAALAVGSLAGLLITSAERHTVSAVIFADGTHMSKIPIADATQWTPLPAGMAVQILAEAGDFRLVETGYGTKGWILGRNLLADGTWTESSQKRVE